MFSTPEALTAGPPAGPPQSDADAGPASPVDYLDKIFQIPYVLAPPPPAALASYLRSLLPPLAAPAAAQETSVPAPGSDDELGKPAAGRDLLSDTPDARDALRDAEALIAPASLPPEVRQQPEDEIANDYRQGRPAVSRMDEPGAAIPDLRPLGLQLSRPEVEFMTRLGPLLPTPRAAKRLVNLYRLVRIGIPDPDLAAFAGSEIGGPYQVVQVLLAVLVGSPAAAQRIFRELMDATPDGDALTVLAKAANAGFAEGHLCIRIGAELAKIGEDTPLLTAIEEPALVPQTCPLQLPHPHHGSRVTYVRSAAPSDSPEQPARASRSTTTQPRAPANDRPEPDTTGPGQDHPLTHQYRSGDVFAASGRCWVRTNVG